MTAALCASAMVAQAGDNDHKKDSEALGWLIVVDQNEIDMAKAAKSRKLDPAVIEFADLMIEEHSKNLDQTNEMSKKLNIHAAKNKDAHKLEKKGHDKLKTLSKEDDKKFQKEYVEGMVKGHKDALEELQKKVDEVSKDLKDHFVETKDHVANHLEKAKDLQKQMDDKK